MRKLQKHARLLSSLLLAAAMLLTGNLLTESSRAQTQGVTSFTATPADIFVNTPTTVTFRATIPPHPTLITTSPNLQRMAGASGTNLGRMYDDGTHGDAAANDNVYTAQVGLNEFQPGAVTFRASVAYQGQIKRSFSNPLDVSVVPPLGLSINSGSDFIVVEQGSSQNVASVITLSKQTAGTLNVTNAVSIAPDNGGITLTSDYPAGGYSTSATGTVSFVLNQSFLGNTPGTYVVTNAVTVQGASPPVTSSDSITVEVLPPGGNPILLPVGADPEGVQRGVPTAVTFTATVANFVTAPDRLALHRVNGVNDPELGELRDDGTNGDLQEGDLVYSGTFTVNEPGEGTARFKASGVFPGVSGTRFSDVYTVSVTCYPVTLGAADMSKVVADPATGLSFLSNEVLVVFREGTGCARRDQIAALVGGTIAGTSPGFGIHQIRFAGTGSAAGVNNAVATLLTQPEVISAKPNFVGVVTTEVQPDDASYGTQYAPQKIRADEAWVIARGTPLVAVVDTGVDYNHEDLAGKVIKGYDYVSNDADPMDAGDHGTHVAGIAAAHTNNGKGIAGISWNSKILAVRAVPGTYQNLADGIRYAANKGAKVINISAGGPDDVKEVKDAVDYAVSKGALVVSTPANLSQVPAAGADFYPGAYPNVFCVGATNPTDGRYSGSNHGGYVDIAAPGENILSALSGGGYGNKSGVSMAAPVVSGAAAVVRSRFPSWTAAQVRARLEKTAVPLPGLQLGAGRIDLFEAVFNGSFEDDVKGWEVTGTAAALDKLGPLAPTHREKMGFASSGPDNAQIQTTILQKFTIQPDVTSIPLKFDYNFVTEEYPEWVNRGFNDDMRIVLVAPDGTETQLAFESVDGSAFTLVGGIDFPGGDTTVGQTGWKSVSRVIAVTSGPGIYRVVVRDRGDGIYDSNVLLDNIRFK